MTAIETLDYAGLAVALNDGSALEGHKRDSILSSYRREIAVLMIALHRARVVGEVFRPMDPAKQCDLCDHRVQTTGVYVDGRTSNNHLWANMCWQCFLDRGTGLGWGVGQLYKHDDVGWVCVAGGNPQPDERCE